MSYSDFKKLLYDLHKENKLDIKEFRKELIQIKIALKEHLQFHKTVQGFVAAGFGICGGIISAAVIFLLNNIF